MSGRKTYEAHRSATLEFLGAALPKWDELSFLDQEFWEDMAYQLNSEDQANA